MDDLINSFSFITTNNSEDEYKLLIKTIKEYNTVHDNQLFDLLNRTYFLLKRYKNSIVNLPKKISNKINKYFELYEYIQNSGVINPDDVYALKYLGKDILTGIESSI